MAPVVPDPRRTRAFASAAAFDRWPAGRSKKIAALVTKLASDGTITGR